MKRNQGAVKLGTATPIMNNIVSLMCGILIFSTVFSVQRELGQTKSQIVNTLQYNGPGNTGLTFIWLVQQQFKCAAACSICTQASERKCEEGPPPLPKMNVFVSPRIVNNAYSFLDDTNIHSNGMNDVRTGNDSTFTSLLYMYIHMSLLQDAIALL